MLHRGWARDCRQGQVLLSEGEQATRWCVAARSGPGRCCRGLRGWPLGLAVSAESFRETSQSLALL